MEWGDLKTIFLKKCNYLNLPDKETSFLLVNRDLDKEGYCFLEYFKEH